MNREILENSNTGVVFLSIKDTVDHDIDGMLDWRNRLVELRKTKCYPDEWYDAEILAVDEIIKYLNEK